MIFLSTDTKNALENLINKVQVNQVSFLEMIISMTIAFVIGLLIFVIYRRCFKGTVYSYQFNLSLLIMTMITAMIILTISSNIVLSLGMVGALSIVRFRSAIKEPIDIVYIFWAIAAGLAIGATQYLLAFVTSIFIAVSFLFLSSVKYTIESYILTIKYPIDSDHEVMSLLNQFKKSTIKSKYIEDNRVELIIEISKNHKKILQSFNTIEKIDSLSLLAFEE